MFRKKKKTTKSEAGFDDTYAVDKKKKSKFFGPVSIVLIVVLLIYFFVTIISQQAQIAQLKKEATSISTQITEAKQSNDEYNRLLKLKDESEYMEKVAIEKLGYSYPNERRFYIVSNDD